MKTSIRCSIKDRAIPPGAEDPVSAKRKVSIVTRKPDLSSNRHDNVCVQAAFFHLIEIQYLVCVGSQQKSRYFSRKYLRKLLNFCQGNAPLSDGNETGSHVRTDSSASERWIAMNQNSFRDCCLWLVYVNIVFNFRLRAFISRSFGNSCRNRELRPWQLKIALEYAMPMNKPDAEIFGRDQSQHQVSCVPCLSDYSSAPCISIKPFC